MGWPPVAPQRFRSPKWRRLGRVAGREIGGVVSEVVSIDRGRRAGIVNFDPVGGESVCIVEGGAGVFGEEFVDQKFGPGKWSEKKRQRESGK